MMTNAGDICEALHGRYNRPSQGHQGEQYVCLEEARSGAGFKGNDGRCDFLAINTWPGRGMELIGHEVKVSMSDWKSELAKQDKAERFARFCRRWYVVVPAELAKKIKDEVPPAWGLMSVSVSGRVTEVVKAPARTPEDVPAWWWVGWLAQIDRQHKRRATQIVERMMAEERTKLREQVEADIVRKRRYADEGDAKLKENAEQLRKVVGIDLRHLYAYDFTNLAKAVKLTRQGTNLEHLANTLRATVTVLDEFVAEQQEEAAAS